MTVSVIELNDAGLRLSNNAQQLIESPGLAVVQGDQLLLGEEALRQYRLHPVNTFSQFWHRLSGEALNINHPLFRHHADLAYSQLQRLHEASPDINDVIFALPGSFTREQMSMLLGIVEQCSFNIVGLVDSSLVASSSSLQRPNAVHIDLQLHQAIVSVLNHTQDGKLTRTQVDTLPGAGLIALRDAWARGISEYFMEQARFDPLHSASSEQSLYDQLPNWIDNFQSEQEAILSIDNKTAKISQAQFIQPVSAIYSRILDKASSLTPISEQLLVSDRLKALPGFMQTAKQSNRLLTPLEREAVAKGVIAHAEQIQCTPSTIHFVLSLDIASNAIENGKPDTNLAKITQDTPSQGDTPAITHCLIDWFAVPLNGHQVFIDAANKKASGVQTPSSSFSLTPNSAGLDLEPLNSKIVFKGDTITARQPIELGDELIIEGLEKSVRFIHTPSDD